jgi:hypothetical protein
MVALFFGNGSYFIDKGERLSEIGEFELAHDVMIFNDLPLRRLFG